jgi:hypothetical protein
MTTWTIDTVTPALFLAAKEPLQKQAEAALQRHSELQAQLAATTVPIRFSEDERCELSDQYLITTVIDQVYLHNSLSIQDVIDISTKLLTSLDSDLTIFGYIVELNSDYDECDSYYSIRKFKLATAASVATYWEGRIITEVKSQLNAAIRTTGYFAREITCPILKLWLNGTIDNKTLQTLVYGVCEL